MEKFCVSCGKALDGDFAFCPACGNPIPQNSPATPVQPVPEVKPEDRTPAPTPVETTPPAEPGSDAVAPAPAEEPARRFCSGCGKAIEGDPDFCSNCGKSLKGAAAPKRAAMPINLSSLKEKLSPKMLMILGIGAAVLLALILILVFAFSGDSYSDALDRYISFTYTEHPSESDLKRLAPDAYWEESDTDIEDILDYLAEENPIVEHLEEEYGKGLDISYEILEAKKLSTKKLRNINETLEDRYGIEATEGYTLEIEMTISGSEDEETDTGTVTAICIDGDWYLYPFFSLGFLD